MPSYEDKLKTLLPWLIAAGLLLFHPGFGAPFRTPKLLAMTLLLAPLVWQIKTREVWRSLGMLVMIWPLFGWLWSVNAWDYLESITLWCVYVLAFSARPLSAEVHRYLERGLVISGFAAVAYVVVQKLGWDPLVFEPAAEAGGFMGNLNAVAHFLLLCLCLCRFQGRMKWVTPAVLIGGILLTMSRGAWLGLVIVGLIYSNAFWRRILASGLLLGLVIGVGVFQKEIRTGIRFIFHPADYVALYKQQPSLIAEREPWFRGKRFSLMTRVLLYRNSLLLARDKALLGVGAGQFETAYPRYAQAAVEDINMSNYYRARSAHNLFLDAIIQFGLPWFLLTAYLVVRYFRLTGNSNRQDNHSERRWWIAVSIQGLIAMVSLNYLNPVIAVPLILTAPTLSTRSTPKLHRAAVLPLLLLVPLLARLDYDAAREHRIFFPERRAARYYREGNPTQAWFWQASAWKQDPYGPETLFNTGLISEAREANDASMTDLANACYAYTVARYPHYRPARNRLFTRLGEASAHRAIAEVSQDPDAYHRALRIALTERKAFALSTSSKNR
ncbi:MAG: O-antigen ligase family protein [Acidobacteriota bacterium]|nr:O-antigen ligase family protein [Acidobacteriota bacterium]